MTSSVGPSITISSLDKPRAVHPQEESLLCHLPSDLFLKAIEFLPRSEIMSLNPACRLLHAELSHPHALWAMLASGIQLSIGELLSLPVGDDMIQGSEAAFSAELCRHLRSNVPAATKLGWLQSLTPQQCRLVTSLDLGKCNGINFSALPVFPNLEVVSVSGTNISGQALLSLVQQYASSLKTLDCSSCKQLQDADFQNLPPMLNLEVLNASDSHISGQALLSLVQQSASSLKTLDCSSCKQLQNADFQNLPQMPKLEALSVEGTNISGQAFLSLLQQHASSLKTLDCSSCKQLQNDDFQNLPPMPNLEELRVDSSNISGQALLSLLQQYASSLKLLNCWNCKQLEDADFQNLPPMPNLEVLGVSYSNIPGQALLSLVQQSSSSLKALDCSGCDQLQDADFQNLPPMPNLEALGVSYSNIPGQALLSLVQQSSSSLKMLNCSDCDQLEDADFQNLPPMPKLEKLWVSNSNISGQALLSLVQQSSSSLKMLNCSGCDQLQDADFQNLPPMPNLEALGVSYSNIPGQALLSLVQQSASSLKELDCSNCDQLEDADFQNLPPMPKLEKLWVSNSNISGQALLSLVQQSASSLKTLDCSNCDQLEDADFQNLPPMPNLEVLRVSYSNIPGQALLSLVQQSASSLKELDCSNCDQLEDADFQNLPPMPKLEKLWVSDSHISGQALLSLVQQSASSLKTLDCSNCDQLEDADFQNLPPMPNLEELNVSYSNISGQVLLSLLQQHASSLKTLHCMDCKQLHDSDLNTIREVFPHLSIPS